MTTEVSIERHISERNELTRIAAQRCLDKLARGEAVDDKTAEWARDFVAMHKPLAGALGTGEPANVRANATAAAPVALEEATERPAVAGRG